MALKSKISLSDDPLYLMDGSAFFYRGFHAYPDLKRSDGFPTNALFIVLRVLLRVFKDEKPKHLAFVLDGKGKNFRHELFEDYKAQRPPMPEDLVKQIEPLKEAMNALGIPLIVSNGEEADDCIASLTNKYKSERSVVIIGADKDLRQCLDSNVFMWDPAGRKEKITSLEDFTEETGMVPSQWPDFQALIGDSADNIPGVPGVGKVTASKIMAEYPTLEDIRDNFDNLKPTIQKKMKDELENMFIYRKLTRLNTDSCTGYSLDDLTIKGVDQSSVTNFMQKYEFRSLARESLAVFPKLESSKQEPVTPKASSKSKAKSNTQSQFSLFGEVAPVVQGEENKLDVIKVHNADELPDLSGKEVGLKDEGTLFSLGVDGKEYLVKISQEEMVESLKKANKIAVLDIKSFLRKSHIWKDVPLTKWFDLSLAAYLLNPEDRNYSWDRLREVLFIEDLPDAVDEVHPDAQGGAALALMHLFTPRLANAGLTDLINNLEVPLIPVLADMEEAGITLDLDAFNEFLKEVQSRINELTKVIYEKAGEEFNIRSSPQMSHVLFEKLELKPAGKTSTGAFSTANNVLEKLQGQHPIIDDILEYRKMEKLRSTYLEPLPKVVDSKDRIHTHFNQLATATGRLSSSGPNLQNIPIRGDQGKRMRGCFTAGEGMRLAAADYSQVELRVLAHFSEDPTLVDAFLHDQDIHSRTAALLFDKEADDISRDERGNAKTINFGLIYGMGPQKLSRELGIKVNEAKEFISKYFEKLDVLKSFYDKVVDEARENGFVTTLSGRRRLLPEIHSADQRVFSQARRQAINTVIQGSAADIIKMAMIKVAQNQDIKDLGGQLILQIHDELIVEGPEENIQAIGELLQKDMQSVIELRVPLKVDLGLGRNWAQAH